MNAKAPTSLSVLGFFKAVQKAHAREAPKY